MTYDEALQKFGLPASPQDRNEIRQLLTHEIQREKQGGIGEEMLRTLCLQLFSLGVVEDTLLIWDAKQSSFDAGCGLDLQFLCGAGLEEIKHYLSNSIVTSASRALKYLNDCEKFGDFDGWTPQKSIGDYRRYFRLV